MVRVHYLHGNKFDRPKNAEITKIILERHWNKFKLSKAQKKKRKSYGVHNNYGYLNRIVYLP